MIAKIRVLGLRSADARALRGAAIRIRRYLEGDPKPAARPPEPTLPGIPSIGDGATDSVAGSPLAGLASYYQAGQDGRSRGRARGAGAAALGFVEDVDGDRLVQALIGVHPITGMPLTSPRGSSGRGPEIPSGSRPVARFGPADELLTIPEAAFLAGVDASRLRRLAAQQPRTFFPSPTTSDEVDPRVGKRLLEALVGRPVHGHLPGADKDYLLAEKDEASGQWRVRRGEVERYSSERIIPETVMGFDLVCALPKSVSLLWAVGDDTLRADIAAAFDSAVDAVVSYLEAHACLGMVDGRNQPGDGLAVASYVHDVSRADEAHLHMHNLIPNAVRVPVRDEDGRPVVDAEGRPRVEWRALDSGALLRHVKTAGYLGGAQFRHDFARLRGAGWNAARNGVAELAGFPADLLHGMSSRHEQVTEEFAQLVDQGFEPDGATEVAAQRHSRPPKTVFADAAMRALQLDKLADLGWTPERVLALIDAPAPEPPAPSEVELADLADGLVGPSGLTAKQTTFTLREVHQAVAQWAGDRLSAAEIRHVAEGFMADRRVVLCGPGERLRARQDPEPFYTTEDLLAVEDNLHALYRQGRVDHGADTRPVVTGPVVDRAIAVVERRLREERGDPRLRLSSEQRDLVRDVLACGDLVRLWRAAAGTGKTDVAQAVALAWAEATGGPVFGSANGGSQTEELTRRLRIEAQVVRSWLVRLESAEDPRLVWPENTLLIVDEATQVSTRDAEKLARWATRTGTVILFLGDPAQLGSVGAGGWFRHMVEAHGAPSLSTVYRQAGADLAEVRAALADLRSGMPQRVRQAMDRLAADGRIRVFDDAQAMLAQVVDDWYSDRNERLSATGPRHPKPSRMMAARRREVDALNDLARGHLLADGTVSGPELVVAGQRFAAGDEVVTLTQEGHTLIPAGATRDRYVRTGSVGVVTSVRLDREYPEAQSVTVDFPDRGTVTVDWAYLTHEFEDGRVGGLALAYAVTADRSQGSNMDAGRAVGTDTTSRAAFYVMVSRGEREVAAYLVRDRDLVVDFDDEQWLPVLRRPGGTFEAVVEQLERSRPQRLASDLDPLAWEAQQLRRGRSLAELAALRRETESDPEATEGSNVGFAVARRAEMAEEAAVGARAVARPDPALVARLGPRPPGGEDRRSWDRAVQAVAAYRSRWEPSEKVPGYGDGPAWVLGPRPVGTSSVWAEQRERAEAIVSRWSAALDPAPHRRFWELIEAIPRERATAGIHALVAAGVGDDHIHNALSAGERLSARAGAAVLEYRVAQLLAAHRVDAAAYHLPPPLTAAEEWARAGRVLMTAEAHHQSHRAVADLAAERAELARLVAGALPEVDTTRLRAEVAAAQVACERVAARAVAARADQETEASRRRPDRARLHRLREAAETWEQRRADHEHELVVLTERLDGADGDSEALGPLRGRHEVLTIALDLLVDRAIEEAADSPPAYLVDLLGVRPVEGEAADRWDTRARQVETWRHHTMGYAYGIPAAGRSASPSEQALGPIPADPALAAARAQLLASCQVTLDLGAAS